MDCAKTYYPEPLTLVSGDGAYVTDDEGRRYLDFFAGIAVLVAGHNHPKVKAAVHDQVDKIVHTSTLVLERADARSGGEALRDLAARPGQGLHRQLRHRGE